MKTRSNNLVELRWYHHLAGVLRNQWFYIYLTVFLLVFFTGNESFYWIMAITAIIILSSYMLYKTGQYLRKRAKNRRGVRR